jgi:hypothetical protein
MRCFYIAAQFYGFFLLWIKFKWCGFFFAFCVKVGGLCCLFGHRLAPVGGHHSSLIAFAALVATQRTNADGVTSHFFAAFAISSLSSLFTLVRKLSPFTPVLRRPVCGSCGFGFVIVILFLLTSALLVKKKWVRVSPHAPTTQI